MLDVLDEVVIVFLLVLAVLVAVALLREELALVADHLAPVPGIVVDDVARQRRRRAVTRARLRQQIVARPVRAFGQYRSAGRSVRPADLPILARQAVPAPERRARPALALALVLFVVLVVARLFAVAQELERLLVRLVAVDLAHRAEHPVAGARLAPEAARMAHLLVAALVIERVGQQQDGLAGTRGAISDERARDGRKPTYP